MLIAPRLESDGAIVAGTAARRSVRMAQAPQGPNPAAANDAGQPTRCCAIRQPPTG